MRKPEREGERGGRRACHYRYFSRPSITVARQRRGMLRWAWLKPRVPSRPAPKEMRGEKEVKPLLHQSSYCFIHVLSGSLAFAPCFVSITWILQWVPVDGAYVSTYISLLPLSVKWLRREKMPANNPFLTHFEMLRVEIIIQLRFFFVAHRMQFKQPTELQLPIWRAPAEWIMCSDRLN